MLLPVHSSRIEEWNNLSTQAVKRIRLGVFAIVASLARERKICQVVRSLLGLRNDMFDGMRLRRERFRALTVLTASTGPPTNCLFRL